MPTPFISIIVTSYNYEDYLPMALDSIQGQTYPNFEVVLVDDGSKDNSLAVARRYEQQDSRFRVFEHPAGKNRGLCATTQLALEQCRGQYIAFLESDDLWRTDCLEKRVAAFEGSTCEVLFNSVKLLPMSQVDLDNAVLFLEERLLSCEERSASLEDPRLGLSLKDDLVLRNCLPTFSCVMLKKSLFEKCDFNSPVPRWLDWWLWQQLAQWTNFLFLNERLSIWRLHQASYNRHISLPAYLRDCRKMWRGIGNINAKNSVQMSRRAHRLVHGPFVVQLIMRGLQLIRQSGLKAFMKKARGKFLRARN